MDLKEAVEHAERAVKPRPYYMQTRDDGTILALLDFARRAATELENEVENEYPDKYLRGLQLREILQEARSAGLLKEVG